MHAAFVPNKLGLTILITFFQNIIERGYRKDFQQNGKIILKIICVVNHYAAGWLHDGTKNRMYSSLIHQKHT